MNKIEVENYETFLILILFFLHILTSLHIWSLKVLVLYHLLCKVVQAQSDWMDNMCECESPLLRRGHFLHM